MSENLTKLLNTFGEDAVAEMMGILRSKGKEASGRLIQSLRSELKEGLEELAVEFTAEDYAVFVDKGRKPGKQPPLNKIQEWCGIKGIDKRAAFPIARKIGREGIPPTDFFEIPLLMRIEMLKQPLDDVLRAELLERVREVAKKVSDK